MLPSHRDDWFLCPLQKPVLRSRPFMLDVGWVVSRRPQPMFQCGHLAFELTRESLGIVQRGLAKAEGGADLRPMIHGSPAASVIATPGFRWHLDRLAITSTVLRHKFSDPLLLVLHGSPASASFSAPEAGAYSVRIVAVHTRRRQCLREPPLQDRVPGPLRICL
jgi:hypothetical protein